jgi:anti-anti-sigma factor
MSSAFDAPQDLVGVTVVYRLCRRTVREPEVDGVAGQFLPVARRRGSCTLVLDFSGVDFLTAAALGRLVALHSRLRDAGGRLVLANLSTELREVFGVAGLDAVLDVRGARPWKEDSHRQLGPALSV